MQPLYTLPVAFTLKILKVAFSMTNFVSSFCRVWVLRLEVLLWRKHIYPSMTESQSFTCFLSSALLNRSLSLSAKTVPRFPGRSETISSSGRPAAMGDITTPVSSVKIVPTAPSALRVFPRIENAVPSVPSAMPIVRTFSRSPAAGS